MNTRIRMNPDAPIEELTDAEFEVRIQAGEIPPAAEIEGGEGWIRMDDLPTFHRLSPRDYPPGKTMSDRLRIRLLSELVAKKRGRLRDEYSSGILIERSFKLSDLSILAKKPGVFFVARCIFVPSFSPEAVLTLSFCSNGVTVEAARAEQHLWLAIGHEELSADELPSVDEIALYSQKNKASYNAPIRPAPRDGDRPLNQVEIIHWQAALTDAELASHFMPASEFQQLPLHAETCQRPNVRDGIGYHHQFVSPGARLKARWDNPDNRLHPVQAMLADAYERIFEYVMRKH